MELGDSEDLIIEIITRLPVKDLMRFTCVSKAWLSLISSNSHFSDLQFKRAASSDLPLVVLQRVENVCNHGAYGRNNYNYRFHLDSSQDNNVNLSEIPNPFHDNDQNSVPRQDVQVIGSVDGLLVLCQLNTHAYALLNPSTGKSHLIPPNPPGYESLIYSGLGYDSDRKCYKLVKIVSPAETDNFLDLMIYDVNGTWRKVRSRFPFDDIGRSFWAMECTLNGQGVYVDNFLYWHLQYPEDIIEFYIADIIGFNIAEEEFFEVIAPDFSYGLYVKMVGFDKRLCFVCTWTEDELEWTREGDEKERTDIWVLTETYDDEAKTWSRVWIRMFSISDPKSQFALTKGKDCVELIPKCYSACGKKVLLNVDLKTLVWYNLETKEFEEFSHPVNGSDWPPPPPIVSTGGVRNLVGSWPRVTTCAQTLVGNGIF